MLIRGSSVLLLAAGAVLGQGKDGADIPATITNLAPFARTSWVSFTVPDQDLPRGRVRFVPGGFPVFFGDSVGPRARLVHVRATLRPYERLVGSITAGRAAGARLRPGRWPLDVGRLLSGGGDPIPAIDVRVGGKRTTFKPARWAVVERGPARLVLKGWGRIPDTQLVATWWFYLYTMHRVVPFELWIVNSDPRTTNMVQQVDEVSLRTIDAVFPVVHWARARGGDWPRWRPGGFAVPLLPATWFGDGQGYAWQGRMVLRRNPTKDDMPTLWAAAHAPAVGMARNWSGRWGPWGVTPALHPAENTAARGHGLVALGAQFWRFVVHTAQTRPPWQDVPLGLARVPRWTGDQQDFGVTKLAPALAPASGGPAHLFEAAFSALYEACRPSYFFEVDGRRIRFEDHPLLRFHGLRPHWSVKVNKDWLGKVPGAKVVTQGGIWVKDWEHISSNNLAGVALLTGSYLFREICKHEAEGYLFGKRREASRGMPRGVGRSLLHASWMYLVTGDPRLPARMKERARVAFGDYLDRGRRSWQVRVLRHSRDGRYLHGRYEVWTPWQTALAITGMDAAVQTGATGFRDILRPLARTFIFYGWWKEKDRWTVGNAVRYLTGTREGQPLSAAAYRDPTQVSNHFGTAFDVWSWPAVIVCLRLAREERNRAMIERCLSILTQLEADNARAKDPGFDRASEWRAVR